MAVQQWGTHHPRKVPWFHMVSWCVMGVEQCLMMLTVVNDGHTMVVRTDNGCFHRYVIAI